MVGYLKSFSTQTAKEIYEDSPNSKEYLNSENVGFDGIERMYQDELRGKNGSRKYPVNAAMKIIGRAEVTAPIKGNNLYLSINKDIQKATERMLEEHIKYLRSPYSCQRSVYENRDEGFLWFCGCDGSGYRARRNDGKLSGLRC